MGLSLGFDFRLGLAESVVVGIIFRHALPKVEKQHGEFAGVRRIGHQQMHASPVQIRPEEAARQLRA